MMKPQFIAALAAMALSTSALAHPTLLASSPKSGASLNLPPNEVRLKFNEPIEGAFSSLRLIDSTGKEIAADRAAIDEADPNALVLHVAPVASGAYTVRWSVVGRDGHRVKGELGFSVK
jgi:methionine-rich copper-binding protein CopC